MEPLKIAENIFNHYESTQNVNNYYGLFAMYALAVTATESGDKNLTERARKLLCAYPDHIEHPYYNFKNYRVGGNGKAWLLFKGFCDEHKEKVREYAELTLKAPVDDAGIMCHPDSAQKTWIDVVTCVTPFMMFSGLYFGERKYIDFAAEQSIKMYERFLDKETGLLHQAKGFSEDVNAITEDHWSRGNGWGYIGLATLVEYLPKDSKYREKAEKYYVDLSAAFVKYQNHKGVWRQEIPCEYAWDECSGTGIITYGLGVGLRLGLLPRETFFAPFKKALDAICSLFINDDFSTNMCCKGCLCPGDGKRKGTALAYITEVYPQKDDGHSFGALMFAMIEAHKNGINDLGEKRWQNVH